MMIQASGITKTYGSLQVLKGVDVTIERGEVVSIVGASGAGKSTLLHIIGTLDRADQGILKFQNKELTKMTSDQLALFRNKHIGFIFQFHNLLPEFTAIENVCIPAYIGGQSQQQAERRAKELLAFLKLDGRMDHKPGQLSGGEQQRVAVARALMNNPDVVLADEPSGNLDSNNARDLHQLFFDLREKFNQTFIIVTHNEELAKMADRVLVMKDGRL